jgi:hypothetical protein
MATRVALIRQSSNTEPLVRPNRRKLVLDHEAITEIARLLSGRPVEDET